jgi:cell division protein FtsL
MATVAPSRVRRSAAATARSAAPVRVPPADRRRASAPPRRHLRVVDETRLSMAARRRRTRAVLLLVSVVVVLSLFALAAFHAMLASGQADLDRLEAKVSDAQATYEHLRLDVAELEAPSRIVREAQERLGMVPPPGVTYLTPSEAVSEEVGQGAAVDPPSTSDEAADRAPWATVKPYLSGRP